MQLKQVVRKNKLRVDKLNSICYNTGRKRERKEDKEMTREEIKKEIERLEEREFMINMVDRWTYEDRKALNVIEKRLKELKEML